MTSETPDRIRWARVVKNRWPTALAITMAALSIGGSKTQDGLAALGEVLLLLPLLYLVAAKLERRQAAWPLLASSFAAIFVLQSLDVIAPAAVFSALALIVLVWGAVDGQLSRPGPFRLQALGMLGFGALALIGLAADPGLGRYLVAAGWFLHAIWDFVHLRRDRVVARSYAEWCGIFDIAIAAELVFTF
ncbi:hypothetical protein [Actinomadura sp. 9N407]|uniref:hypothetical protein n=1 Tax=Actinomadura sp. 9N407 TaxID=3375154 RepID=UPI0037A451A1